MPEWWSYGLTDFLLFSPRTYYRLIERHNAALWPAHLLTLALGLAVALLILRPTPGRSRATAAILAVVWAWVGWAFVWSRYTTIKWAATYFALLFAVEALLLGWIAGARGGLRIAWRRDLVGIGGAVLFAGALLLYPLLSPGLGRGWAPAESFGIMPDPTAVATLGLVLGVEGPVRRALLVAPLLWCALSGATLWAMGSAEAWVLLPSAGLALLLPVARRPPSP
jgi:hypothetical protein